MNLECEETRPVATKPSSLCSSSNSTMKSSIFYRKCNQAKPRQRPTRGRLWRGKRNSRFKCFIRKLAMLLKYRGFRMRLSSYRASFRQEKGKSESYKSGKTPTRRRLMSFKRRLKGLRRSSLIRERKGTKLGRRFHRRELHWRKQRSRQQLKTSKLRLWKKRLESLTSRGARCTEAVWPRKLSCSERRS